MKDLINQQWTVGEHPTKEVNHKHFKYHESSVPALDDGQILIKSHYLNVAPVMRMYMMKDGGGFSTEKLLTIGDVIHGRGVGEVIDSQHPDYKSGDFVHGQLGWQTYKISSVTPQEKFVKMKRREVPIHNGLSVLGMTGYSAYCGFIHKGQPKEGDIILVSGAAGGVGSMVVQIAKAIGCSTVIGIAGGTQKCNIVRDLGANHMIDYKSENVKDRLEELLPDGCDVFFDNVGGPIFDASLNHLKRGARVVLCGAISEYALKEPFIPQNIFKIRRKAASLNGFFVYDHKHQFEEAETRMAGWIKEGKLKALVDIDKGFDRMPHALIGLYTGTNIGKRMVKVSEGDDLIF